MRHRAQTKFKKFGQVILKNKIPTLIFAICEIYVPRKSVSIRYVNSLSKCQYSTISPCHTTSQNYWAEA